MHYHSVNWFLYDWITWAIWVEYLPNVSNIYCEMYTWKIVFDIKNENPTVRLATSASHNSWSPNFTVITLKFKVSSLKEDSGQILVCASFKCVNKICQNNIKKYVFYKYMSIKFPTCTSFKHPYIWFKISAEKSVISSLIFSGFCFPFPFADHWWLAWPRFQWIFWNNITDSRQKLLWSYKKYILLKLLKK